MTTPRLYEVGGCVRDDLLGLSSKDIDFAVEVASFDAMRAFLEGEGFEIFVESPEYLTIRARAPRVPWQFGGRELAGMTADFVMCRQDGNYSDGRRPDTVTPGDIFDDLGRRDFTVNAIARTESGEFIDPWGGVADVNEGVLRAVGDAEARLREDALRALRALRFQVTKPFAADAALREALNSEWLPPLLWSVSEERKREELRRMFRADTCLTLNLLAGLPEAFRRAVFGRGLWLDPSLRGVVHGTVDMV